LLEIYRNERREAMSSRECEQIHQKAREPNWKLVCVTWVWGGVSLSHWGKVLGRGRIFFIFVSRNAHFGAFSGPSEYLLLQCNTSRYLHYACLVWHSRLTVAQSKALEFLHNRILNVIFPGGEYATKCNHCQRRNTESQRQQLSRLISDGHEFWGRRHGPDMAMGWVDPWVGSRIFHL